MDFEMYKELSMESVALLSYLLPGFLAAMVFYALTSHPKPSQFERIVQALVLTLSIQALLVVLRWMFEFVGGYWSLRPWDASASALASTAIAIAIGVALAYIVNTDKAFAWLRARGFTSRTSHPSEWYCVLSQKVMFVVLHLSDGRRLYGWPKEWPIESHKGQFYLMLPAWIKQDGSAIDLPGVEGILIQANDVRWVEFINERGVES